eukprot:scaffold318367_cov21-Tisochrysis_lutea.AAC.1
MSTQKETALSEVGQARGLLDSLKRVSEEEGKEIGQARRRSECRALATRQQSALATGAALAACMHCIDHSCTVPLHRVALAVCAQQLFMHRGVHGGQARQLHSAVRAAGGAQLVKRDSSLRL